MNPVSISTLGEFSISYGDNVIAEKDKRSKKMWILLKYMTAFRDRAVTHSELTSLLWDGDDAHNPAGALKTQLHRLRAALAVLGIEKELVVSYAGTYAFNNELEYTVDAAVFEEYFKKSLRDDISEKEQIGCVMKAFELYKGSFLKNSAEEKWVIPIRVYYHSIYVKVVYRLLDALYRHKQYTELINIAQKALLIEGTDKKIHALLIKAQIASGEREAAKKHYKYVTDLLYNELGENPGDEFRDLFRETLGGAGESESDLEAIKSKLRETDEAEDKGAFYCELDFFKTIYRLKLRDAARTGEKIRICLITVSNPEAAVSQAQPTGMSNIQIEMQRLWECVSCTLRKSDIFARYSISQYVLMLPAADTDSTGEIVVNRIVNMYMEKNTGFLLHVDFKHVLAND